jgi:hypothetical protein
MATSRTIFSGLDNPASRDFFRQEERLDIYPRGMSIPNLLDIPENVMGS